jgi:hypothetical protein
MSSYFLNKCFCLNIVREHIVPFVKPKYIIKRLSIGKEVDEENFGIRNLSKRIVCFDVWNFGSFEEKFFSFVSSIIF